MDPPPYGPLTFNKAGQDIQYKSTVSSINGSGKTGQPCRRLKPDYSLTPYTKINSKWMKDFHARQESIKILEENTGSNLFDLGHSNFLLDTPPKARETKAKVTTGTSSR